MLKKSKNSVIYESDIFKLCNLKFLFCHIFHECILYLEVLHLHFVIDFYFFILLYNRTAHS